MWNDVRYVHVRACEEHFTNTIIATKQHHITYRNPLLSI